MASFTLRRCGAILLAALSLVSAAPSRALHRRNVESRGSSGSRLRLRDETTPCGQLFEVNDQQVFAASDVAACMATVPFNATVATQLLQYYRDLVVFQSTLAYLNQPPASYQQPAINLLDGLNQVQRAVDAHAFTNEYDFETSVLRVVYGAHDGHLDLDMGISGVFGFGSSYAISSISVDGIQPPKPYLSEDILNAPPNGNGPPASAIAQINGQDAVAWLTQFAADNSFGLLDPNADWNAVMETPAGDIQALPPLFNGGAAFNPGDTIEFTLENGITISDTWMALIDVPFDTPPLTTGEDLYNFFVLANDPTDDGSSGAASTTGAAAASTSFASASVSAAASTGSGSAGAGTATSNPFASGTAAASTSGASAAPTNWLEAAGVGSYPDNPIVYQPDLGAGGSMTGYFLDDPDVAVLSIPSFDMSDGDVTTFSSTTGAFLHQSKTAGKSKIVIDLQQNYGGNALLAVDVFKQFFPSIDPFTGSRMRAFNVVDALGTTYTQYWVSNNASLNASARDQLVDLPWAVLDYTDAATSQPFASWPEYYGPHADHGDLFTTIQRDNLSNALFDEIATGGLDAETGQPLGISIYGYGNRTNVSPQPFPAANIILLTDAICHSACALFVEMMHHEAGVRTVVIGGRPSTGPMQAVAGSRGAQDYDAFSLDSDMAGAVALNGSIQGQLPASHLDDLNFLINTATINLRDQIRRAEDFPLQFAYEAADCRIYWTAATAFDFAALWQYAADAIWGGGSGRCVPESTIFASMQGTNTQGPSAAQLAAWGGYGSPTHAPILPPSVTVPAPVPVAQSPDGQIVATGTPAMAYYAAASASSSAASSASGADADDADDVSDTLLDDIDPKSRTLNQPCPRGTECNRAQGERCVTTSTCANGRMRTGPVCKRQCTHSKDCGSALKLQSSCALGDYVCQTVRGRESCSFLSDKSECVGSCLQKSTLQHFAHTKVLRVEQGFCRSLVPPDAACAALEDATNRDLLQHGLLLKGGFQVVEPPESLEDLETGHREPLADQDAVVLPGEVASVADSIMRPF